MPKKKGAAGAATRVSEQIAAETVSASDRVAPQPDDGRVVDAHQDDNRAILNGAELQRIVTQVVADVLAAQSEEVNADRQHMGRIEAALTGLDHRIAALSRRLSEISSAPPTAPEAAPAVNAPTPRLVSDTRGSLVRGWRQSLWISETNQSKPLPMPRPTIVGRALSDLGATSRNCDEVTTLQAIRQIHASGQHHLDQNALWNLESATSSEKTKRNRATSGLSKLFKSRFKQLKKSQLADDEADRRWLTSLGRDVFNGWPGWQVEHDDEECEGDERLARRRPEAGAGAGESAAVLTEPLPGSVEGGNASGPTD